MEGREGRRGRSGEEGHDGTTGRRRVHNRCDEDLMKYVIDCDEDCQPIGRTNARTARVKQSARRRGRR